MDTSSTSAIAPATDAPDPKAHGPFAALRRALPAKEVILFLVVGACNTVISFGLYWLATHIYSYALPHQSKPFLADLSSITAKPISITISFLGFKHFVFKTKGNYLKEWVKCLAVYSISTPAELIILPVATKLFLLSSVTRLHALFLAGIVNSLLISMWSYFGHKKFSFKR